MIIATAFLLLLLLFFVEYPVVVLELVKAPLKEMGVEYGEVKGGLLSGFEIHDINYQDEITAKKVHLKVDVEKLEDRVLHIEQLELENLHIDKNYLKNLLEDNSSSDKKENNSSLPFDSIVVDRADISLNNIEYNEYFLKSAKVKITHLKSDLKQQYIGDIYLLLDSNVTKLDLNASINSNNVNIFSTIEPKKDFLHTFSKDYNVTFNYNPRFTLKIEGDITKQIAYHLTTKRLGIMHNEHQVESNRLILMGQYGIESKHLTNHLDTALMGSMAELSLVADTQLNIEDINHTLLYDIDLNTTINSLFLNPLLSDYNTTFSTSPHIELQSSGNFKRLSYHLKGRDVSLTQNEYVLKDANFIVEGDYSILDKDISAKLTTTLGSSVADPVGLDLDVTLNLEDINNTLEYSVDLNTTVQQMFINPLVAEQNVTFLTSPEIELKSAGNFEHLTYDIKSKNLKLTQNAYEVRDGHMHIRGDYSIRHKDVTATVDAHLNSNVATPITLNLEATLNLDDMNNSLEYRVTLDSNIQDSFLNTTLAEQNITFLNAPHIEIESAGNFKKLTYKIKSNNLQLKQNEYEVYDGHVEIEGDYSILHKEVSATLHTILNSNVADPISMDVDAKLNLDDINSTLKYNLKAHILPQKAFVQSKLPDNLHINRVANLEIVARGDLSDTKFVINFKHLSATREEIEAEISSLKLRGKTNILEGNTTVDISTNFSSTLGEGHIQDHVTLNFNQLKETLKYQAKIEIDASSDYLNGVITDKSMEIEGTPKIHITLDGGMNQLTLQLKGQADVLKDKKYSKVDIQSSPIVLNFKKYTVEGKIKVTNDSDNMGLNFETSFQGDYRKPESLNIRGDMQIDSFNAFGINLDSLAPFDIKIRNDEYGSSFIIDSKRIQLKAKTTDKDHYTFELKTGNIYLYKLMSLPEALEHKFVKLDIRGDVTLSTQYFNILGDIYSNKRFNAKIIAKNDKSGLDAIVKSRHLFLTAKGDIENKQVEVKLTTHSLYALQNEFHALYDFKKVEIEGGLSVSAKLDGDDIHTHIVSESLMFDGFNIEQLDIDALYTKELLTLNKLNFTTTGFEDDSLNRNFYLNQKGLIGLGDRRDVLLDMHPSILVKMRGDRAYLEGKIKVTKLPLGLPAYGSMVLTTDIDYRQEGKKKQITGDIFLKKMKLFYEAKFLDADYDSDVVIVTKHDKAKEKSEDDFLQNTFVNITIHAPEANYKTPDIDLLFDINIEADKEFGEELSLLGKVEEINGRFDQVPKRFHIVHSNVVFKGGNKINPLLDIHVEYELPQVLITIKVGGSANRPKIEFTSEPPMPKKDILSYLLLGVSTANFANGEGSVSREAELFIINQAARDLAYEVDFDRVFVKDDGTGEGFAIEVGKKISPKNMIILETSKEGNSIILEHDISKNIKLRVGHHQKEQPSQSIDIFFRKRFK